ncbi:hypothetical protein [Reyranella sp.]|uniref:hypothetical protein n=1 Tax=Reyranella sp. TaxID=1929291 RepID=UPI001227BA82|nr:hypothetical protein [Reyranella sp.]TAJ90393.1 MAG: hypothetical protein EPO50_01235 [Reyranella sp.]
MSTSIADERRLLSADEYEPVVRSHYPALNELNREELTGLVRWLRERRAKFRGQVERRRRAQRGKAEPRAAAAAESSERGVAAKKQVFARALKRANARLDRVLADEKRATMGARMAEALARKRAARVHHPATGRRARTGAQPIENPKGADIVPGSAVGSISQATRVAQARRDNKGE